MNITINKKEYKIKYTIRALFIFEQITKKAFAISTLLDNYVFFYSLLLANNDDVLDWDEFIDALDNDPNLLQELTKIVAQQQKNDKLFGDDAEATDNQKKS